MNPVTPKDIAPSDWCAWQVLDAQGRIRGTFADKSMAERYARPGDTVRDDMEGAEAAL